MKPLVVLAVLIGILVIACSAAVPTPDIDATVVARVAQERAVDVTVEARVKQGIAARPTPKPEIVIKEVPVEVVREVFVEVPVEVVVVKEVIKEVIKEVACGSG